MREEGKFSAPYQLFMLGLCLLALGWLALDTLFTLDPDTREILFWADTGIAIVFLGDFVANVVRAADRRRYLLTWGWIDFVSSIPAVGILRIGRAARVARILRILRGVRSIRVLAGAILRRRAESAFLSVVFTTILVAVFGSIAVVRVERAGGGNITNAWDGLWWAVVTVSTAGFGDLYPVTVEGRIIAMVMLVTGIGLFGTFTALVASWFVGAHDQQEDRQLAHVREELAEVKSLLKQMRASAGESNFSQQTGAAIARGDNESKAR